MIAVQNKLSKGLSISVLLLLILTVIAGTSENINAQLLKLGVSIWDNYFILRAEAPTPSCDPDANIDDKLQELEARFQSENKGFSLIEDEFDRESSRISLIKQLKVCQQKHHNAEIFALEYSTAVAIFASLESAFAKISIFSINHQKTILILLLMLCANYATWKTEHIAFRSIHSKLDHFISYSAQFIAGASLSLSSLYFFIGSYSSGTKLSSPQLLIILALGSAIMASISLYRLFKLPSSLNQNTHIVHSLLTVPIHTWMLLAAAYHFLINEQHLPGIAVYFTQIFHLTNLHLSIALYIWAGMLLKETLLPAKLFAVFTPWKLPPELLACVAILLMAVPTAYTGASGIIIIAMGAVAYQELRRIGTRRQLALAVTAMTGSSGVVLRPCLLVVGIAILNKEVLSDELFYWGSRVFMLTLLVFCFFVLLTKQSPLKIPSLSESLKPSLKQAKALTPYMLIFFCFMAIFGVFLNAYLDEFSAPILLPIILIGIVFYEHKVRTKEYATLPALSKQPEIIKPAKLSSTFDKSVRHSAVQIGALLMLMACSFTVGGIIERSGGSLSFPEGFDSTVLAMLAIVVFLVFIGMIMDPFGALILVSGIVAPVAYQQGIEPIHFWMTCLVAFELGYLTPPVSLNHLLTKQVVGSHEVELALKEGHNFYYRHERILLPLLVMSTTLIIVAFGPLILQKSL
jgi:TRAP-type C4-dicarboxylate transport system permease large subunit